MNNLPDALIRYISEYVNVLDVLRLEFAIIHSYLNLRSIYKVHVLHNNVRSSSEKR